MDSITKEIFRLINGLYPNAAITLTHQFLDGRNGNPAGFIPNSWDGVSKVTIVGQWWNIKQEL